MKRMSLLIDQDNVLARIMPIWLGIYSDWVPDDALGVEDIRHYDLTRHVKYPKVLLNILNQPNFFYSLEPLPGAVEYFGKLNKIADVSIITQPPLLSDYGISEKKRWVAKYWPEFDMSKMWFGFEKYKINGDLMFDDNPKHLSTWKDKHPNGITVVPDYIFTRDIKVDYRFDVDTSWEQLYDLVLRLSRE
jgi:5'(3')-deoxyribonucleotidase